MNNPHGEFECSITGQVLLLSARGPWNDETMRNGVIKMSADISRLSDNTSWAQLSCLYGESLMPPSTFNIFVKQTRIRKARGLTFLAVVILDTDIMLTTQRQISQCYELAGVPYCFYSSVKEALDAISLRAFKVERKEAERFFNRFDFSS